MGESTRGTTHSLHLDGSGQNGPQSTDRSIELSGAIPRPLVLTHRWGPWILLAVGLFTTAALFSYGRRAALDDFRSRFEASMASRATRVSERIDNSFSALRALAGFIEGNDELDRSRYAMFGMPLWQSQSNLESIGWAPSLRGTDRMIDYPAVYGQPLSRGTHLKDPSMASDPSVRSAIERARDEGRPIAVWQGVERDREDVSTALLLFVPVYRRAAPVVTKEERNKSFRGVVFGVLPPESILQPFLESKPQFLTELVKRGSSQQKRVFYRPGTQMPSLRPFSVLDMFLPQYAPVEVKMITKGEEWAVKVTPGPEYLSRYLSLSYWMFLPVGLMVSLLGALLLHSYISHRDRMERTVQERTSQLREHEQHLEDLVKERTQSLEWKTAFLEALANATSDGIVVVDSSGKRVFENRRSTELWKMPDELCHTDDERSKMAFIKGTVRDPHEFFDKIEHLNAHPDEHARDEIRLIDGRILDRFSSPVWGKDGTYYGRIWSFHDITDLKAAEEVRIGSRFQSRDALDLARVVYWEADPETMQFTFNDPFYELFATSAEREGGYHMTFEEYGKRFVHPDDLERLSHETRRHMANHDEYSESEHRAVRRDGKIIHILTHARNAKDDSGKVIRIYGANQDITGRKLAEQAIMESENKFRALSEKSIVGVYLVQDRKFKYVNAKFAEIHGYTPDEMIDKKGVEDVVFAEDGHIIEVLKERQRLDSSEGTIQQGFRILTKQGDVKDVEVYASNTSYLGKNAIIGTLVDVTERKRTEEIVRWKTAFLEAQLNSSLDGIMVIDTEGKTILQNERIIDMWKIPRSIVDRKDDRRQLKHIVSMTKSPEKVRARLLHLHNHPEETGHDEIELKDGGVFDVYSCPVRGEDGNNYGRIWTFRDITELKHYWDMLENLSTTDGLTELPNRRRFDEFLNREWRRAMRDQSIISLILMDIDFFKEFNDHYGHLAGDDCLRQVAGALKETVCRPGDLVARYGGEEFVCVLPDTDSAGAVALAHKMREQIETMNVPHFFSRVSEHVTLSFGVVSLVPGKGQTVSHLIQLADDLLYSAKQSGRDQVRSWRQATKGRRANAV